MFGSIHTLRRIAVRGALVAALGIVAVPQALAGPGLLDGRSPDTRDAARIAHQPLTGSGSGLGARDGWYPYAVSVTEASRSGPVTDGRSPDTRDFAALAHSPVVTVVQSSGFAWGDFGIGVAAAFGAVLLIGVSKKLLTGRQARKQPGPVATA